MSTPGDVPNASGQLTRHSEAETALSTGGFYAGLFLITSSTLMLQLIQTRILSVVAWYHLAFFVISMAMFGLTAGAVWVYLRNPRFTLRTLASDLSNFSTAFAVATAVCLATQTTLVPMATKSLTSVWSWVELAICISIPFFFSGVIVSLALTRSPFPIGLVYGVDLIGAAVGCLGVLFLLQYTDGPSAILWVGAFGAVAALLFAHAANRNSGEPPTNFPSVLRFKKTIAALIAAAALINGMATFGLQPLVVKGRFEDLYTHIFREWNSFSRVAVFQEARGVRPAMWGPSPKFEGWTVDQRVMNIDGDAGTTMYRFAGDLVPLGFLRFDVTNMAYFLPHRTSAAIIGVGGGRDMLSAALFGVPAITGVEINPIFIKLLTTQPEFVQFNALSKLPSVRFVNDEGRSWFARTRDHFDLIQMSLIDTWAATGAGAFTLSENGLYTTQALKIFLSRLTSSGVFTVSRWYSPTRVQETGRMLSLAVAALIEIGAREPRQHLFLCSEGRIGTLIISRSPFTDEDLKALSDAAREYQYKILLAPDMEPESEELARIVKASSREELEKYTSNAVFDLTPPTDDRPFFFNQFPFRKPLQALILFRSMYGAGGQGGVYEGNLTATGTLLILFCVALGLVLATIVIPLRPAVKDVGVRLVTSGTAYFLLIGIGFMTIEIGLLQRTSVYLGHPMYALSVLLFTLILSTGLGSLISERLKLDSFPRFACWASLLAAYVVALPLWLGDLLLAYSGADLLTRAGLCILAIAPAGVMMGFGFPTGMRLVTAIDPRPTPWFWGINGAAGVLASIVAVAISIASGIGATLMLGGICYLLLIAPAYRLLVRHQARDRMAHQTA
jgi:hypothetical protein